MKVENYDRGILVQIDADAFHKSSFNANEKKNGERTIQNTLFSVDIDKIAVHMCSETKKQKEKKTPFYEYAVNVR